MDKLSFMTIYPEVFLLVMACAVLLLDLAVRSPLRGLTYYLSLFTTAALALYYGLNLGAQTTPGFLGANPDIVEKTVALGGLFVNDALANSLKFFASIAMFASLVYGRHHAAAMGLFSRGGELFAISLFMLLGITILSSSGHMLMLYLGLELLSLSTYGLVAMNRDNAQSIEAAIKYFVLGCIASGFLLFGMSLLYGATGHLMLVDVFMSILQGEESQLNPQLLLLGTVLVVAGIGFKFSAVPFHMWAPDVYQGSPTLVTLFIAGAAKFASLALVLRLLVEGLGFIMPVWQQMTLVLAVASLLVGNLAAIAQVNIYRMLAFSTIAHVGFIFLALSMGFVDGDVTNAGVAYSAALFYTILYVLGSLAVFGVLLQLGRNGKQVNSIHDLAGLGKTQPFLALVMALALFSFAGIPPLAGFFAKFSVLMPLLQAGTWFYIGIALFAVIMALIGCFYYLRVVKIMYFDAPAESGYAGQKLGAQAVLLLALNAAALVLLGLMPDGLLHLCGKAIYYSFGL